MSPLALFAVDPAGMGVALRGAPGPARDRWLARLHEIMPDAPVRRMPLHIAEDRLLGGLDLAATLRAGRPVASRGLLADAEGGVVVVAMAERVTPRVAAHLSAALDRGAPFGVVALDEGTEEERTPAPLLDRLAFHLAPESDATLLDPDEIADARALFPRVRADDGVIESLCATAAALGIASLRAPLLALRVARAAAALSGREQVSAEDATVAAQLVLAPRATILPAPPQEAEAEPEQGEDDRRTNDTDPDDGSTSSSTEPLADTVLQAAAAAIPPGLLARLQSSAHRARTAPAGRAGAVRSGTRGRPAGIRAGDPRQGLRLNLIETLRAAAPWQRLRTGGPGVRVRREDFRVTRLKQRSETTTIFLVDASGSQAINRLSEAKGAVEMLLSECYARRDQVAVLAFRGRAAQTLLPPTRSLVRAKRSLAGLPGGGGTPIASGLDAGCLLADKVQRRGGTPALVLLTDGRANVARDGRGGREAAARDADDAAHRIRNAGHAALLIDTSARPHPASRRLAGEMGATYLALPFASAASLSQSIRAIVT